MYQERSLAMSFSTEEDLAARHTLPQAAAEHRRTVTFLSCMPFTSDDSTFPVTGGHRRPVRRTVLNGR